MALSQPLNGIFTGYKIRFVYIAWQIDRPLPPLSIMGRILLGFARGMLKANLSVGLRYSLVLRLSEAIG